MTDDGRGSDFSVGEIDLAKTEHQHALREREETLRLEHQAAVDAGLTPASDCLVRIDSALAEAVALSPAFGKRLVVNVRLELKKMRPLFVSSFIVSLSYRF